jgi:hypothetical protein
MKNHTLLKKAAILSLLLIAMVGIDSCKKTSDPNVLTGETNIPMTQVNSQTTTYVTINGVSQPGSGTLTVLSNNNGLVTYGASVDLNTFSDSALSVMTTLLPQAISYYNPKDVSATINGSGVLNLQFTLKITSEGIQNYFVDGQPWTVRYADGVGTKYTVKRTNGTELTATVTEKTGLDEWPYGMLLIKTSLVEYDAPVDDPVISKVYYRVNHKFGLVYLKVLGKNGKVLEMNLLNYFLM